MSSFNEGRSERENKSSLLVVSQEDISDAPRSSVGAKAATLARMAQEGVPVPNFFCLSSAAFALHLSDNQISWPESVDVMTDLEHLRELRDQIVQAPVPGAVRRPALECFDRLCSLSGHDKAAVRSSGSEEDSASSSFAGQFTSLLGVDGSVELLDAVKECWASYLSDRSLSYRASRGMPLGRVPSFGVIVQVQVFAEKAGVLFTVHPLEPHRGVSYIEANFGTGESVVGGLVNPDAITISRSSGEIVEAKIATKRRITRVSRESGGSRLVEVEDSQRNLPVLTDAEAQKIVQTGLRIEELMDGPQDIEWAFDSSGLWILQSRPLTGPGSRGG